MWGGILSVLKELEVKKIIIGKQREDSEQYEKFCKIVKDRKIPVSIVKKGDLINIEKDLKIRILFPVNELISENILNNNSLVFRLEYENFKMLFTGDIEEKAETEIVRMYTNGELKSDILKVAHHGSKTSTTEKFLELVDSNIAVIGVGGNNKFGHPNEGVIERLKECGNLIYRTDKIGEIIISINKEGKVNVNKKF